MDKIQSRREKGIFFVAKYFLTITIKTFMVNFFLWGHEKWSLNVYDKKLSKFFYPDVTQNAKRLRVIKRGTRFWPKCQQIKFEDIKKKRQKVG